MIPAAMHRLAARLGIRDGEAYTVVTGLVVALVLAGIGLPGVLRGHDALPFDQAAAAQVPATVDAPAPDDFSSPSTDAVTRPSMPALSPAVAPTVPVADAPAPTTTAPPLSSPVGRPLGDVSRFAETPHPSGADGMAVSPDGTVYVASDRAGSEPAVLWAFSSSGRLLDAWVATDQPPIRTRGLTGVAVDPGGTVLVSDASTARVLRLDRAAGALVPVAAVPDLPACGLLALERPCEPGLVDSAPLLTGIAAAPDGTVVVADQAQGVVWRLAGAEVEVLAALDDRLPADGPIAVSFLSSSELLVAVGARFSSFPPGLPAVLRIRLAGDRAQAPEVVADLELGEVPGDLVAGDSGRVYVTIPSAGAVVDLGVDQGDRIDLAVESGDSAGATPTGVALRDRSLLLSDPSGPIFDLSVNDRPVS